MIYSVIYGAVQYSPVASIKDSLRAECVLECSYN